MKITLRQLAAPAMRLGFQPGRRGEKGEEGDQGPQGNIGLTGAQGDPGFAGWTPTLAVVTDGVRRVQQVVDWQGGDGTKPPTGQYVGATGLVSTAGAAVDIRGAIGSLGAIQARLSLSSTLPVTDADITTASLVYLHPVGGLYVPVWDGTQFLFRAMSGVIAMDLDSNTGHGGYQASGYNFDFFLTDINSGVLQIGTGPAWSVGASASPNPDIERATGANSSEIEMLQGIPVNKNAITLRLGNLSGDTVALPARRGTYVGSFRATANGVATDTKQRRLLYNVYNQTTRILRRAESTAAWTITSSTWRQANADTGNQVEILTGLAGTSAFGAYKASFIAAGATEYDGAIGVFLDTVGSTPAEGSELTFRQKASSTVAPFALSIGLGYHKIIMGEKGTNSVTNYFRSASDSPTALTAQVLL